MGAHAEALGYARPTAATILAGIGGWHGDDPTPGACCLGFEDGTELRPARITDALGEMAVPYHVGDPQIFEIDGVVLAQQHERRLVVEVRALALHLLMRLAKAAHRLAAPFAALLAAAHPFVGLGELLLRFAVVTRILDRFPISGDEEHLQAYVYARLASGGWQGLRGNISARDDGIPPIRFFGDRDGFGRAFQRARPAHGDASDLAQHEKAVIESRAVAILLVGETVIAVAPLEARCLPSFHPAEERLIGLVQSRQDILQDLRVDVSVFRERRFQVG